MKIKKSIKKMLPERTVEGIKNIKGIFRRLSVLEENQMNLINSRFEDLTGDEKTTLKNKEFKIYSQNGEDGILLYIFSNIGAKNRNFVEIGCGNGKECNTANLSLNHGWSGLLIEGNKENWLKAKNYYKKIDRVKVINSFITKENVNEVLKLNRASGKIDLLSIDIDGNDYWIWEEIKIIDPRVVVIEYNGSFGKRPISIPYEPNFKKIGHYHGASLKAMEKLGKKKGYILIGCEKTGCNAFFVKQSLAKNSKILGVKDAFYPHSRRMEKESLADQFKKVANMKFIPIK